MEIVLQRGSEVEINAVVYSPDGRLLASAGESETIRLWDRKSGDLVRTLPGHDGERVMGLAFSPDGKFLASCGNGGRVKLWDYRAGQLVNLLTNHVGNWTRRVAFSPDSRRLAAATYDGKLSLWDTTSGAVALSLPSQGRIADVVFMPDGRFLITASREPKTPLVQFWDTTTGERGLTLNHSNSVNAVAISRDGRRLAVGEDRGAVNLWELPSGRFLRRIELPGKEASVDVDFSPDGQRLATSGHWLNRVWATDSGAMLFEMRGHEDGTVQISFSPDGSELASASSDASVRQWNARSGELRRVLAARPPNSPVTTIAFSPDGRFEAVSGVDGVVRVWDAHTGEFRYSLRGHEGPVQALTFTLDSAWLCSGSTDRTVRIWDTAHGTISVVQPLNLYRGDVIGAMAVGGRERLVAFGSGPWADPSLNRDIQLWQTHYERPSRVLRGHTANVRSLAYAPQADRLVSASADRTVKLWDSRQGECLATITNEVFADAVTFAPDGLTVLLGMADGSVHRLSADNLALLQQWPAHRGAVRTLAFSGDGRWLATASSDQSIAVWEWTTGRETRRFSNVTSQYLPMAFHPKRPVLAFAQRDEMLVHANVETGEVLFQRALFPDGEWLAWNPAKVFYTSSPRGHEHARLRFAERLAPVYPLELYRAELSRPTNLLAALASTAPALAPKDFQLWWHRYTYKQAWLYAGLSVVLVWVGVRLRLGWIAERRRRAQENISRQLLVSQEAERKRIAAELHDSLGQNLLIIKNRLYLAQQGAAGSAPQLQEISQTVLQTIDEVREISHNLRPYQLDRLGLTKAVEAVVKKIADSGSLAITSDLANIDDLFPPEGEINFYRIVQESLNNVLKHSDASTARISIQQTNGKLTMSIEDDGRGFDCRRVLNDAEHPRGFGLTGLGERVRILGGRFDCDSTPGQGTRLTFEIAVPAKRCKSPGHSQAHENGN